MSHFCKALFRLFSQKPRDFPPIREDSPAHGPSEASTQTELRHPIKRGRSPSGIILRALSARPKLLPFIAILITHGGDVLPADLRYPLSAISLATKIPLAEAWEREWVTPLPSPIT